MATDFPLLGQESSKATVVVPSAGKQFKSSVAAVEEEVPVNPRLERPVCRFAAMDMYKCKTRRAGKLCHFRHPEEAEDKVTDEEYMEALRLSLENLNKTKAKYGQKPIKFSADLYSKYNYPGRFKSHLVKPLAKVKAAPQPVKCLASVLTEESNAESSPLFNALQTAYVKKSAVVVSVAEPDVVATSDVETSTASPSVDVAVTVEEGGEFTSVTRSKKQRQKAQQPVQVQVQEASSPTSHETGVNYFHLLSGDSRAEEEVEVEEVVEVEVEDTKVDVEAEAERARVLAEKQAAAEKAKEVEMARLSRVAAAEAMVDSGVLGAALVTSMGSSDGFAATTAAALVTAFLAGQTAASLSYQLFSDDKYGLAMKHLTRESGTQAQVGVLEAVELFCHSQGFVKVSIKSGEKYLIDVLFRLLYAYDLVEEEAFFEWYEGGSSECSGSGSDGFSDGSRTEVKLKAVMQTTEFFTWLLQDAENSGDDDDDVEVCGGKVDNVQPRPQFQRQSLSTSAVTAPLVEEQKPEEQLSKAERKALKQQRRQERVADRGGCEDSKLAFRLPSSTCSLSLESQ